MAFAKPLAQVGTFGLAGLALSKNRKRPLTPQTPQPSMITSTAHPTSMIGPSRGGY